MTHSTSPRIRRSAFIAGRAARSHCNYWRPGSLALASGAGGEGGREANQMFEQPASNHAGRFAVRRCAYTVLASHNYAASRGPTEVFNNPSCACPNPWQSLSQAPLDDPRNFAGPFTRLGTQVRLAEVTDGLANTIFFGEVRPRCSEHARNGWAASNNGNGFCTTLIPINFNSCDDAAVNACNRSCNWSTELGFRSLHANGAWFAFGDGSTHFVSATIDHSLYQNLGAKADGNAVALP